MAFACFVGRCVLIDDSEVMETMGAMGPSLISCRNSWLWMWSAPILEIMTLYDRKAMVVCGCGSEARLLSGIW